MKVLGQSPRRLALKRILLLTGGLGGFLGLVGARSAGAEGEQLTVSGGGVNVKGMPSPESGEMVPLRESFSFDARYAQCIIEDNPAAFAVDTHAMGRVVIEPHSFFMGMYSDEMSLVSIRRVEGKLVAKLAGQLGCATYAGTASVSLGSRTAMEPALFEIEAVDGGHGGSAAGDNFSFTVFFDPQKAPLNYAIFGPKPTFTGEMVAGEITIGPPVVRPIIE